jgi:hypothetical protein
MMPFIKYCPKKDGFCRADCVGYVVVEGTRITQYRCKIYDLTLHQEKKEENLS